MSLSVGELIDGKYEIKRLLGEGGMGAVYEGENVLIHRKVAIKVLHSGVASNQEAVTRFEREAQAAGRIGSDHIVEVLDLGTLDGGDRYMVMEFLKGESLSDRIAARGKLSAAEICDVGLQLLEGLQAAHEANIIHRDLKPDNVFLLSQGKGRQDFVKILDFGISKFSALGQDFSMTRTGSVMGTPYYMAPEQARGAKNLDARLDVYAAGVILYQAATGRVPFDGETFNELLIKIVTEDTPPVSAAAPELDAGLASIIDKARQRDPAHRFQSAREFREALQSWLDTSGSRPLSAGQLTARMFDAPPRGGQVPAFGATAPAASAPASASALAGSGAAPAFSATASPVTAADAPLLGAHTNQSWANTAHAAISPVPPKRRWGALGLGTGAVLAAVLGIAIKLRGDAAGEAARAAAAAEAAAQKLEEARLETERKLAAERARSEALAAQAEQTRAEIERVKVSVLDKQKEEAERREQEQKQAELAAAERAKAAAAAAAARPRSTTQRRPSTTSTTSTSASGGRKIRTSL